LCRPYASVLFGVGKTGHKWAGNAAQYDPKTKKYTVIHEKHGGSGEQAAAVEALSDGGAAAAVKYAPAKVKGKLADFTNLITSSDMFSEQLASMGIDTSKMPLGDISQRTIDDGFAALLAVEKELEKARPNPNTLAELCGRFYTFIPHAFGRQKAPLLRKQDIQGKKDLLNVLSDVGSAVTAQKKQKGKAKAKLQPAPIDELYSSLACELRVVDPKSDEFKMIDTYAANTQGNRKCTVVDVFAVDGADASPFAAETADIGNRKLLWHGTNVAVVAAILKSGLRIMPHSGGRVGSGIYLASENGKSASYVTAQGHTGVMFLCEAALGKQRIVDADGQVGWHETDPVSAHSANSCLAIGQTEPDPSADTTVTFDGKEVVVPQGKVGPNPMKPPSGASSCQLEIRRPAWRSLFSGSFVTLGCILWYRINLLQPVGVPSIQGVTVSYPLCAQDALRNARRPLALITH
jgi:poly [ADP-ribose] polymerase